MVSSSTSSISLNQTIQELLDWIFGVVVGDIEGLEGIATWLSPEKVAEDYLRRTKDGKNVEEAIDSLIAWRTAHAAGTGFLTGIGGLPTLPASLAASYGLGAHTIATIAHLRGYDIYSDQVKTALFLSLLGGDLEKTLKEFGIVVSNKVCFNAIKKVPGKVLIEINKKVGFRLITKAGNKGMINLTKMVPIAGGVVGGGFDSWFVNTCGQTAKKVFPS